MSNQDSLSLISHFVLIMLIVHSKTSHYPYLSAQSFRLSSIFSFFNVLLSLIILFMSSCISFFSFMLCFNWLISFSLIARESFNSIVALLFIVDKAFESFEISFIFMFLIKLLDDSLCSSFSGRLIISSSICFVEVNSFLFESVVLVFLKLVI